MLQETIFEIKTHQDFEEVCLDVFRFQYINNPIYQRFCNLLGVNKNKVNNISQIPFLPIEFFKKEKVLSGSEHVQRIFTSSGTTGSVTSKHYIKDLEIYKKSFIKGFELFYGPINEYAVLALLPSYLEREGSSLVYMVDHFIKISDHKDSGFYLYNTQELIAKIKELALSKQKTLLIGVSFALLDLIEEQHFNLPDPFIVIETGGMKGRRKELIREELHSLLKGGFQTKTVHSEYGMTELLSQAYSRKEGLFDCPPWMKVLIRDTEDPLTYIPNNKTGGINIIDLANIHSCSFIATQDLGKIHDNGSFEVLGRFDHSDIRGCNLMVL